MSAQQPKKATATTIPAAWLRPLPPGYVIPLWRWLLLPATAWMLKRAGGVWVNGELTMFPHELRFLQTKVVKLGRTAPVDWRIPLKSVIDVSVSKGFASETIEIRHEDGYLKFMTVRSDEFVARLKQALPSS